LSSVVFHAPKKPESTVTGSFCGVEGVDSEEFIFMIMDRIARAKMHAACNKACEFSDQSYNAKNLQ
jgi:hypothetical protein